MTTTRDLLHAADMLIATSADYTEDEFAERLSAFVDESADKLASLRVVCKAYEAKADGCKAEAKVYAAAAKTANNRAESIEALAGLLVRKAIEVGEPLPGAKMVGNGGKVPLVYAPTFAATDLPFSMQRVVVEADSDAIRAALERGEVVEGVTLGERGERLKWTEEPTARASK